MASRPVIVLDALLVRSQPTGVGRSILDLTEALSELESEFDFKVLATSVKMFDFLAERDHWDVVECSGAGGGTLRKALYTQAVLPGTVRRLGGDLLHSLQFVAPVLNRLPSVVTVHDLAYLRFPQTIEQPRASYYRAMVPASLRRADVIVTNSEATAADVGAWFPGVADKIHVTPFGTPTWVRRQPECPQERRGGGPFLFVGTLEPRKNLEKLLEAYSLFLERRPAEGPPAPDLALVGGRGWRDSRLQPMMERLVDLGKLRLEGYCDGDRLWSLYCSAHALLFPSLHEGFGFPILEAMVAGLPVLTSDRGAMVEVAGDAALRVNPDSIEAIAVGLDRLVDDPGLREILVQEGRVRAERWSWQRCASATLEVYRRIFAHR